MDLYKIIVTKENYSEWGREALTEKLDRENDHSLIDLEIKKHEASIKELQQKKQRLSHVDKNKVNEILTKWRDVFISTSRNTAEDYVVISWINRSVMPELRAAGCKDLDAKAVLNKFMSGRIE